jgi:hypothetical protein
MNAKVLTLAVFPVFAVGAEVILKVTTGQPILPGLASSLAGIGLGQVMPFVMFESLLTAKILTPKTEYAINGAELIVRYPLALQRDPATIEGLRLWAIATFLCSLLLWLGAVGLSNHLRQGQSYSLVATGLGVANCVLAWLFLWRA